MSYYGRFSGKSIRLLQQNYFSYIFLKRRQLQLKILFINPLIKNKMKKYFIITLSTLLLIFGCNKTKPKNIAHTKPPYAQKNNHLQPEEKENIAPSIKDDFLKTKNSKNSPVTIVTSNLSIAQYSDHKNIKIVFKNSSKKNIQAIKLEWYCENSFDEPANGKSFYGKGKYTGEIARLLEPGRIDFKIWEDFSTDANRIIKVRAYYVVFTDGTKWELK